MEFRNVWIFTWRGDGARVLTEFVFSLSPLGLYIDTSFIMNVLEKALKN